MQVIERVTNAGKGINHNMNIWEKSNGQEAINFSPEVHMLAGTLVLDVSTNTWWFSG
jgi:hypothetical protein